MLIHRLYDRQSLRLSSHNYAAGRTYFVTFCTAHRDTILSQVIEHRVHLSPLGRLVARIGFDVMRSTTNASLLTAIIMPDHIHALICMREASGTCGSDNDRGRSRSLSGLVSLVKGHSAIAINQRRGTPGAAVWQRGFHDHIIRHPKDLAAHYRYVLLNPHRWSVAHRS
jgi:putative transposase